MITQSTTGGITTVTLSNEIVSCTIKNPENAGDTLSGMVFTDSDGTQWQWDILSQSFLQIL